MYIDVNEVTEDCLSNASNEADQTTVNRHMNCMLQLALQLALFKVSVQTQSLTYNVCNHHSVSKLFGDEQNIEHNR